MHQHPVVARSVFICICITKFGRINIVELRSNTHTHKCGRLARFCVFKNKQNHRREAQNVNNTCSIRSNVVRKRHCAREMKCDKVHCDGAAMLLIARRAVDLVAFVKLLLRRGIEICVCNKRRLCLVKWLFCWVSREKKWKKKHWLKWVANILFICPFIIL